MSKKTNYNATIKNLSLELTYLHYALRTIDFKKLDSDNLKGFKTTVKALEYYTLTLVELSSVEGVSLAKENPNMVKDLITNIENFVKEVKSSLHTSKK